MKNDLEGVPQRPDGPLKLSTYLRQCFPGRLGFLEIQLKMCLQWAWAIPYLTASDLIRQPLEPASYILRFAQASLQANWAGATRCGRCVCGNVCFHPRRVAKFKAITASTNLRCSSILCVCIAAAYKLWQPPKLTKKNVHERGEERRMQLDTSPQLLLVFAGCWIKANSKNPGEKSI